MCSVFSNFCNDAISVWLTALYTPPLPRCAVTMGSACLGLHVGIWIQTVHLSPAMDIADHRRWWTSTIALLRPRRIDAAFLDRVLLRFNKVVHCWMFGPNGAANEQGSRWITKTQKVTVKYLFNKCVRRKGGRCKMMQSNNWYNGAFWSAGTRFQNFFASNLPLPTVFQEPWVAHSAPNNQMPLQRLVSACFGQVAVCAM